MTKSRLLEAWEARAAELAARAASRPRPLREMTPAQRARYLLDRPYPHGGSCSCGDCVMKATAVLDELIPDWQASYRRGRRIFDNYRRRESA